MNFVTISNETFNEFKKLLSDNGMGCGGPTFNIVIDEKKENDISCTIEDITFIISNELHDKFGDFVIEGTAENNKGLVLRPINKPSGGGCGSCGGGCQ